VQPKRISSYDDVHNDSDPEVDDVMEDTPEDFEGPKLPRNRPPLPKRGSVPLRRPSLIPVDTYDLVEQVRATLAEAGQPHTAIPLRKKITEQLQEEADSLIIELNASHSALAANPFWLTTPLQQSWTSPLHGAPVLALDVPEGTMPVRRKTKAKDDVDPPDIWFVTADLKDDNTKRKFWLKDQLSGSNLKKDPKRIYRRQIEGAAPAVPPQYLLHHSDHIYPLYQTEQLMKAEMDRMAPAA
jgi:hypothetical protein